MGFLLPLPHPSLVAAEQPKGFCVQVVRPHPSSARSPAWLPAEFKVKSKAPTKVAFRGLAPAPSPPRFSL